MTRPPSASPPASRLEQHGTTALVRLTQPARMNPLSESLQQELLAHLDTVAGDLRVRALVLIGEGKAFCAGADLTAMAAPRTGGASLGEHTGRLMREGTNRIVLALHALPVPVVVALNGVAAGAGVGLALAGDITIAARGASFLLPFLPRLGIVPDMGSSHFLERRLGRARAMGLALLGERLTAERAAEWGLIWACEAEDGEALEREALALAGRLGQGPAHAVLEARALFDAAAQQDLASQLEYEARRQAVLIDGVAFREGCLAFQQRREPVFEARSAVVGTALGQ